MTHWSGEVEFDFVGAEDEGNFVATGKIGPMLTTLLAQGDIEGAVRLYEGADASVAKELLAGVKTMSSVSLKNLGQMFFAARDFANAARIFEFGKRWADAARTFEQGGDYANAARCFEQEGDRAKAAAAWDRCGNADKAIELYEKDGPSEALAVCLARQHRFWQSALVYERLSNVRAEVEMLRMVPLDDPQRIPAVKRLGDLLERHGHLAPAAQLLVETLQQVKAAQSDQELLSQLIRRFEAMGRPDHAARIRVLVQKQAALGAAPVAPALAAANPAPSAQPRAPAAPVAAAPARPATSSDPFDTLVDPFSGGAAPAAPGSGSGSGSKTEVLPPDPTRADPFGQMHGQAQSRIDAYGHLKAIPIFGELALQDMKDLYRICDEVQFPGEATLIEQGQQGKGLFVILQGQVQILRVEAARATPLASLGPGANVGELSLIDDAPTSARVVAQGPVRALFISRARFQQFLYTHETAALRIFTLFTKSLAERLRQANRR